MIRPFAPFVALALAALGALAGPVAAAPSARFSLTIDGVEIAAFSDLHLVGASQEADGAIVLDRVEGSAALAAWSRSGERKNAAVTMLDYEGSPVVTYSFTEAWPSKVEIGALKADGGVGIHLETVTLGYARISRVFSGDAYDNEMGITTASSCDEPEMP
jgi:hypothetical protein